MSIHVTSASTVHLTSCDTKRRSHLKPLETLCCAKSMFTVSFDKHSMRFCSSFLQVITKNQCCPQIVVRRHKTGHVDSSNKHWYIELGLLSTENLSQLLEGEDDAAETVVRSTKTDGKHHL